MAVVSLVHCWHLPCPCLRSTSHATGEAERWRHSWSHLSPWTTWSFLPTQHKKRRSPVKRTEDYTENNLKKREQSVQCNGLFHCFPFQSFSTWKNIAGNTACWLDLVSGCYHMVLPVSVFFFHLNTKDRVSEQSVSELVITRYLSCNSLLQIDR